MRIDPRKACANTEEKWFWAFIHDLIAHPIMALTNWGSLALKFHDWTSHHAWPRKHAVKLRQSHIYLSGVHRMTATEISPNIWRIEHPTVSHVLITNSTSGWGALDKARDWFDLLAAEFGGSFDYVNS